MTAVDGNDRQKDHGEKRASARQAQSREGTGYHWFVRFLRILDPTSVSILSQVKAQTAR